MRLVLRLMRSIEFWFVAAVLCLGPFATCAPAQQPNPFAGDYAGTSGPIQVRLHLALGTGGSLTGTIDVPNARITAMPISDVHANGNSLSFSIPAIHGAWSGFLSADGKTLSGMYNQGDTVPLDLRRLASGSTESADTPSAAPATRTTQSSTSTEAACPVGSMANYWDGTSWKPLTMAQESGRKSDLSLKRGLRNPLNPMAGRANVYVFDGAAADVTLGENPRFCFPVPSINTKPQYFIGILSVKHNEREVEKFVTDSRTGGGSPIFPADKTLGTNIKLLSNRFVEVTPKEPLNQGQYVIGANGMLLFDFGVQ